MEKGGYTWALDVLAGIDGCCSQVFSVNRAHIYIYICDSHVTDTSLPIPTMNPICSGQTGRNAAFLSFLIQRGGRVIKGFLHISVLQLLVMLHHYPHICI